MTIDLALAPDIGALVGLRLAYLREDSGPLDADTEARLTRALPDYFQAHLGRDLHCYVARTGSEIAACAFLLVVEKPPGPAFMNGRTGTVLNVYTCPDHRRRGLAGRLMARLVADARAMDICVINLLATDAGYPVYRTAGFIDDVNKYHPMKWKREHKEDFTRE